MKKILFALAIACVGFTACQKEMDNTTAPTHPEGKDIIMYLTASQKDATKTTLDGTTAKWKSGDRVTVMYKKTGEATWSTALSGAASSDDSYATATFSATLASADAGEDAYAIYPSNELSQTIADKAKITIAATQHPTGTDFDGASDIMISKNFTPAAIVTTQFARAGAVLKITINNASLAGEKIHNLTVEGPANLAGDVLVGLSDKTVKGIENGSTSVTAEYESANRFAVDAADKYVYLIVMPQTWASGSTITVSGETDNYTFTKDIVLSNDIYLNPGHIVPLRVSISSITLKDQVFFKETFGGEDSSLDTGSGDISTDDDGWTLVKAYAAGSGGHSGRFGTGSAKGSAQSKAITIPVPYRGQNLKLYFKAAAWNSASEATTLAVSATGTGISLSGAALSSGKVTTVKNSWSTYELNIGTTASSTSVTVKFEGVATSNARFFLDDVTVYYGTRPLRAAGLAYAITSLSKATDAGKFTNTLTNPYGLTVSYVSSNTSVATVDESGEVTIVAAGSTRITASTVGNAECAAGSAYYDLTVIAPPTLAFSWTRSGTTDTVTSGYTLSATASSKSGYYQDPSSGLGYVMVKKNSSIWASTPSKILFSASVGAGSSTDCSAVYACLVDGDGDDIAGTTITVTTHITTAAGDTYDLEFDPVASACGVKIYHTKAAGYNIRYFSMSLSYLD